MISKTAMRMDMDMIIAMISGMISIVSLLIVSVFEVCSLFSASTIDTTDDVNSTSVLDVYVVVVIGAADGMFVDGDKEGESVVGLSVNMKVVNVGCGVVCVGFIVGGMVTGDEVVGIVGNVGDIAVEDIDGIAVVGDSEVLTVFVGEVEGVREG